MPPKNVKRQMAPKKVRQSLILGMEQEKEIEVIDNMELIDYVQVHKNGNMIFELSMTGAAQRRR